MDIMIDLETLGTNVDAPIISLGAQSFDLKTGKLGPHFYAVLDVVDQIDSKVRFADASTIRWWMGQDNAAKTVFRDGALPTQKVLSAFAGWVLKVSRAGAGSKAAKNARPWGNGSSFDITLLETLFKAYDVACPWLYYNVMDFRTFKRFVAGGEKLVIDKGVAHNALNDAKAQAEYVLRHFKDKK